MIEAELVHVQPDALPDWPALEPEHQVAADAHGGVVAAERDKQRIERILRKHELKQPLAAVRDALDQRNVLGAELDRLRQRVGDVADVLNVVPRIRLVHGLHLQPAVRNGAEVAIVEKRRAGDRAQPPVAVGIAAPRKRLADRIRHALQPARLLRKPDVFARRGPRPLEIAPRAAKHLLGRIARPGVARQHFADLLHRARLRGDGQPTGDFKHLRAGALHLRSMPREQLVQLDAELACEHAAVICLRKRNAALFVVRACASARLNAFPCAELFADGQQPLRERRALLLGQRREILADVLGVMAVVAGNLGALGGKRRCVCFLRGLRALPDAVEQLVQPVQLRAENFRLLGIFAGIDAGEVFQPARQLRNGRRRLGKAVRQQHLRGVEKVAEMPLHQRKSRLRRFERRDLRPRGGQLRFERAAVFPRRRERLALVHLRAAQPVIDLRAVQIRAAIAPDEFRSIHLHSSCPFIRCAQGRPAPVFWKCDSIL